MSEITEIKPIELWRWLHEEPPRPFFILDVRNADETARWRTEGKREVPRVEIPYFEFIDDEAAALQKVPSDLGVAVVVCAKGGSSEFVAQLMRESGREALNLVDGMVGWGDLLVPLKVEGTGEHFELWQVNRYGKGCLSYVAIAGGEAAVVDPARFVDFYEEFARQKGARIVEVLETHVHADHISGGAELARRTGANYRVVNGQGHEPTFGVKITPTVEGEIRLGGASGVTIATRPIATPGHTPGSTSYLVDGRWLLSGDTLFVKGVGRPDLGGQVEAWGRALFDTLHRVVAHLPDELEVLPAHFGCRSETDPRGLVHGPLGTLRRSAPEFDIGDVEAFVEAMKAGVKAPPSTYGDIVKTNLGLLSPSADEAAEWELGRNECAVAAGRAAASLST